MSVCPHSPVAKTHVPEINAFELLTAGVGVCVTGSTPVAQKAQQNLKLHAWK